MISPLLESDRIPSISVTTPSCSCTHFLAVTPHNDVPPDSEALIVQHMALVGHIVRETMSRVPSHVDRDDLTSAGLTALVQAAQAFDAERGVPFNRYAATRIRGAIVDELRSIDWASRSVRRRARELDATRAQPGHRARPRRRPTPRWPRPPG